MKKVPTDSKKKLSTMNIIKKKITNVLSKTKEVIKSINPMKK
jgi:hypothetical protein